MKKILFSIALFAGLNVNAQLPAGSYAENFTVSAYQPWLQTAGLNGNGTYTLYDYLDAGYTVFLDVSATWCGPCWNFHNTHALDQLYAAHGPAGQPGVNANTTNDVMVIWMDGDGTTADATMLDGAGAIGNWIEPAAGEKVQYPMANPASALANQIGNNYDIAYFPTVYRICRDRILEEVGQANATTMYNGVGSCPDLTNASIDARILNTLSSNTICGPATYTPKLKVQNNGLNDLSAATVNILSNGNVVSTGSISSTLGTYDAVDVTCTPISNFEGGELTIVVNPAGDVNPANGTKVFNISGAPQATGMEVFVEIVTDQYGSETTWTIKNDAGATVLSGGPYTDLGGPGETIQPVKSVVLLNENDCYTFTILDEYNDGISGPYGNGSYTVKDASGNILATGGEFGGSESKFFKSGVVQSGVGLSEYKLNSFVVYPNPSNGVFTINSKDLTKFESVELVDQVGRKLNSWTIKSTTLAVELSDIENGNYTLVFKSKTNKHIEKIQINK